MQTHFAPPYRTSPNEINRKVDLVSNNPVISKMLESVGGLLLILDENRQIVATNDAFLQTIGVKDPTEVFGLRPGEAVNCMHAKKEQAGCGTSKHCSTCGAAIAIASALEHDTPVEKTCSISAEINGNNADLFFSIKSYPIQLANKQFVLLFLQDITANQQRKALERTFFHDVSNMLQMLVGASELLVSQEKSPLATTIYQAALRLQDEITIQRCLSRKHSSTYQPIWKTISTSEILEELQGFFKVHPLTDRKDVDFSGCHPDTIFFITDHSLLWRVLHNMLINALEATPSGETVKIWFEQKESFLTFKVWNTGEIKEKVANRIFERNFSTKGNDGRGLGTYSMKYFGENVLKGKVFFTSTAGEGTTFYYTIPISGNGNSQSDEQTTRQPVIDNIHPSNNK
ncbi:MAG: histidine kinase [Desulfotalea sp.]|nr:MAG: histidine kinase [Desulfotalea sp.]